MSKSFNFDIDDPLGDILSDGSDDSFFGTDGHNSKKNLSKVTVSEKKKSNLFDLDDNNAKPETPIRRLSKSSEDIQIKKKEDLPETHSVPTVSSNKVSSNDIFTFKLDEQPIPEKHSKPSVENKLGKENRKELKESVDKTAQIKGTIFDDILSTKDQSKSGELTSVLDIDDILGKQIQPEARKSQLDKKQSNLQAASKKVTQPKAELKKKSSEFDWLQIPSKVTEKKIQTKKVESKPETSLPAWLIGSNIDEDKEEQITVEVDHLNKLRSAENTNNLSDIHKLPGGEYYVEDSTALCLQQEEQQLMVALQLKAQEEKLAALQERQINASKIQKELLLRQQTQMTSLLDRQSERRKQMQEIITRHQEKINERIKSLLLGSADVITEHSGNESESQKREPKPDNSEKRQLLQLIETLQANHDKEIELLDSSYRKQLSFVELSSYHLEECMKEEKEKIMDHYGSKVKWLEQQQLMNKELYQRNVTSIQEMYTAEVEKMKRQHEESVRILQEQHRTLVQNLTDSINHDQAVIQDTSLFSQNLIELVGDVKKSRSKMEELVNMIVQARDEDDREKERALHLREKQTDDLLNQLKNEKEYFQKEQLESRQTAKLLEERLRSLGQNLEEQTVTLKRKQCEIDLEKESFSKQSEIAQNSIKKHDEHIKAYKEELQLEYESRLRRLDEDRSSLRNESERVAVERSNLNKLKQELEMMKLDLQVQLDQVNEDRSRLNTERQKLTIDEQKTISKSRDLDELTRCALDKQSEAERKMLEAENSRRAYEAKLMDVQEYTNSLVNRERNIAKEKVALSRERLNLHNERRKHLLEVNQRPTWNQGDNLIYGSASNGVILNNFGYDTADHLPPPTSMEQDFVDPKLLLLKLDIEKVLKNLKENKSNENNYNDK